MFIWLSTTSWDIEFEKTPNGLLDGGWTYMQIGRYSDGYGFKENSGCSPQGGGFRGVINTESIVSMCCANHCGNGRPQAVSKSRVDWTLLKGESQLNGHDNAPGACTFFEAKVSPGEHQFCCANCWASGIFMAAVKPSVTKTTTTATTTSATTTTTTDTAIQVVHDRVDELETLLKEQKEGHEASAAELKHEVTLLTSALRASDERHASTQAAFDKLQVTLQTVVSDLSTFKTMAGEKYIVRGSNGGAGVLPTSKPGTDGVGVCSSRASANDCAPTLQTVGGGIDVTVSACCGNLRLESSACSVDPCETADDVETIKRALGLP